MFFACHISVSKSSIAYVLSFKNKIKEKTVKNQNRVGVCALVAAMGCAGIVGCALDEGDAEKALADAAVETAVASDAAASGGPESAATAKDDAGMENIASGIVEWLKPYQTTPFTVENDGKDVYIRGTVGRFPTLFNKYDIVVNLNAESREAVCYGYLPTKVPEERKAEMTEFLFRAECAYGFSPATIVFECDGSVRCQTWCPLSEFENAPEIAKRRLAGSVMEKLFAYSRSVGEVLLGGNGTVAASRITPATMFEKVSVDSKADMAEVLKICFPDGGYETSAVAGGWLGSRFGNGDGSVGFIEARIDDVRKDIGGIYETLEYALVVRDGMVCNVCQFPVEIPKDRLGAVADLAMRLNESLKYAHFGVDFENGKLWSHYSLPVSALASEGGSGERQNLYPMWIKIQTILNVAKNSEAFSELLRGE